MLPLKSTTTTRIREIVTHVKNYINVDLLTICAFLPEHSLQVYIIKNFSIASLLAGPGLGLRTAGFGTLPLLIARCLEALETIAEGW